MAVKVNIHVKKGELADKPGSVESNHSSGIHVTVQLKRPTQKPYGPHVTRRHVSLFGLAPGGVFPATHVAMSAVRSYRTISPLPSHKWKGGIFSVALSVGLHRPDVIWHLALWSPDFPPEFSELNSSDYLANSKNNFRRNTPI